jgi:shikimate 5-dehydrogenase
MISGTTTLIADLRYPTHAFKAPLIYNPWLEKNDIDAVVVPMGVKPEVPPEFPPSLITLSNIRGAVVTMPHKVTTIGLVDEITPTANVAGAANAVHGVGSAIVASLAGAGVSALVLYDIVVNATPLGMTDGDPGRHGPALRADPGLPRVLRVRDCHGGRPAGGLGDQELT